MASRPGPPQGTTFLTGTQAAQILEKLKVLKNIEGQTIKIQTIQTNPHTGARQIVAIPIQTAPAATSSSSSSSHNLIVSPMKTINKTVVYSEAAASPVTATVAVMSGQQQQQVSVGGRTIKIGSPRQQTAVYTSQGQQQLTLVKPHKIQQTVAGVESIGHLQQRQQQHHHLVTVQSGSSRPGLSQSNVLTYQHSSGAVVPNTPPKKMGGGAASFPTPSVKFEAVKRPHESDPLEMSDAKRRKTEKGGKGLRHFSMKVCEKVKAKGSTSYNEVADELVTELTDPRCQSPSDQQYDQKNIRRRVYDALNVLMAMNIISKEKKEIRWLGLPTNSVQEAYSLETTKAERIDRIKSKTQQLQDLILQQIAFKNLVERNRETEKTLGAPTPNSAIQLPFIVVNTSKKTVIDCSISNDKMEYLFNFDNTFEIHDDMEVLKRMNMTMGLENGTISQENLRRTRNMVPRALQNYVDEMAQKGAEAYTNLMPKVSTPNLTLRLKEELGTDYEEEDYGGEDISDQDD